MNKPEARGNQGTACPTNRESALTGIDDPRFANFADCPLRRQRSCQQEWRAAALQENEAHIDDDQLAEICSEPR